MVAVLKSWVLLALLFASWMQIGQRRTLLWSPVTTDVDGGSAGEGYVSSGPIYPFGERLTLQNGTHGGPAIKDSGAFATFTPSSSTGAILPLLFRSLPFNVN